MANFIDLRELEKLSIVDFLARLGHFPVKKSGKEHFYHSMLRETSCKTPSLTVWDEGGVWLDRGGPNVSGIQGGGIVQLAMAYWHQHSFGQVLAKILETSGVEIPECRETPPARPARAADPAQYAFSLINERSAIQNPVLREFLQSRGVLQIAPGRLSEIYYRKRRTPQGRSFYAVGWKNEHNAWEFTSAKGFKSSIGPKGISIIPGSAPRAVLFEGYMDYLSWLIITGQQQFPTVVVLNSVGLLQRAIEVVKHEPAIDVYFDNDTAGRNCTAQILRLLPQAKDRSYEYEGYKDYNELLIR